MNGPQHPQTDPTDDAAFAHDEAADDAGTTTTTTTPAPASAPQPTDGDEGEE